MTNNLFLCLKIASEIRTSNIFNVIHWLLLLQKNSIDIFLFTLDIFEGSNTNTEQSYRKNMFCVRLDSEL